MTRPPSIKRFERLYLASFGLSLIGWATSWSSMAARLASDPRTVGYGWFLPAALVLSAAITLALWWSITRGASRLAKWIVVVLTALAVLRLLISLPSALQGSGSIGALLLMLGTVGLSIMAALQLFHADSRAWLGEDAAEDAA